MKTVAARGRAVAVFLLLAFPGLASGGQDLSLKDVIQKNLEASGGRDKLGQFKNLSFKSGNTLSYVSASAELKISMGKEPVVTEVVLVKDGRAQRNSYGVIADIPDPQKTFNLILAKLYAGLFSLLEFEENLKLEGLKSFGPEKLYHLTLVEPGAIQTSFFLRPDDFHLKRLLFRGKTPEGDIYEVNTDFGPFESVEGFTLPLTWFSSQVGARGTLAEVTDVRLNQPLPGDLFSRLDVNVGSTEAALGRLKGNVLDFNSNRFGLSVTTNWKKGDVEKAGFRTGDPLSLQVEGVESELIFYAAAAEVPNQNAPSQGARVMTFPWFGETYVLQFVGVDTAPIEARLRPLAAIEIRKR